MAKFLTTSGISSKIETIIKEAKGKIVLVSPFLQLSKTLLQRLNDASDSGKEIKLIYREDKLKIEEKEKLYSIINLKLFHAENLHAKCYFNESEMIITSMNLYEFSEKNNREMGVVLYRSSDKEAFDGAIFEIASILKFAKPIELVTLTKPNNKRVSLLNQFRNVVTTTIIDKKRIRVKGFCVRCSDKINYDTEKPFCRNCYYEWSVWERYDYEEKFCHCCGNSNATTMAKPECYSCYSK